MKQPKRFIGTPSNRMEEWIHGTWVDYKDYAAVAAENKRLKITIKTIYRIAPLLKESVASALLAAKEGGRK